MNIWRLIAHHEQKDLALRWITENERIAVGWGKIGDLSRYNSAEECRDAIRKVYPEFKNSGNGGRSLWNLFSVMKPGDLVIISAVKARTLVVEVMGNYEYVQDFPYVDGVRLTAEYQHQRRIRITNLDAESLWHNAGAGVAPGQSIYQTLVLCSRQLNQEGLSYSRHFSSGCSETASVENGDGYQSGSQSSRFN